MISQRARTVPILAAFACALSANALAEVRTYRNPMHQGHRLDYCAADEVCGEAVATQWCRAQGYEYASDWSVAADIGASSPTLTLDESRVCADAHCDGFAAITCGREDRTFRMPSLGPSARATVITPDRRGTARRITTVEYQLLVPGCHQREPGVLLCETLHDYQHCRTLLQAGRVSGCRAGLAFDGAFADPSAAAEGSFELDVRSSASASVERGRRGEGGLRGNVRYALRFDVPPGRAGEACLQRDRYVYYPTGPRGGFSTIDDTRACNAPLRGEFVPHEDDLLSAYDLCEGRNAWGERLEMPIELMVAALFHFAPAGGTGAGSAARIAAPYVSVRAPMRVDCRG